MNLQVESKLTALMIWLIYNVPNGLRVMFFSRERLSITRTQLAEYLLRWMSYSIITKLSCFRTFSYHTSKGDCDPDSEHDYCSLHVRLRAGQVTDPSFFKLSLDQFFWWRGFWVTNFHWIIFFGGKFFKWQTCIESIFGWEVFLVTLLEFLLHSFFLHWIGLVFCQICIILFVANYDE